MYCPPKADMRHHHLRFIRIMFLYQTAVVAAKAHKIMSNAIGYLYPIKCILLSICQCSGQHYHFRRKPIKCVLCFCRLRCDKSLKKSDKLSLTWGARGENHQKTQWFNTVLKKNTQRACMVLWLKCQRRAYGSLLAANSHGSLMTHLFKTFWDTSCPAGLRNWLGCHQCANDTQSILMMDGQCANDTQSILRMDSQLDSTPDIWRGHYKLYGCDRAAWS